MDLVRAPALAVGVRRALNAQRSRTKAICRGGSRLRGKKEVHAEKKPTQFQARSVQAAVAVSINTLLPAGLEHTTYGS
jgi:hypothetical protein